MSLETFNGTVLANNIRAERSRCKITQDIVASKIGVSLATYRTYEIDAKNISALMLYQLSMLFECNVNDFYMAKHSTNMEQDKQEQE